MGIVAAIALQGCGKAEGAISAPDLELVWSDEFDGDSLDRTKWTPEAACWGGGNEEHQCYVDSPENIRVEDGALIITARPEPYTGYQMPRYYEDRGDRVRKEFTSGKVKTKGLASWTYGRFEARIKLPKGQSTWPAFWMLPQTNTYGVWPRSGEIDIMEAVNLGTVCELCTTGEENRSMGALHFGAAWPQNAFHVENHELPGEAIDSWHVYAVDWREGKIEWSVDGEVFFSLTADDWFTSTVSKSENPNAPFDHPFYLILNLAVGGNLPDGRNEQTFSPKSFPAEMKIDWVRVYN